MTWHCSKANVHFLAAVWTRWRAQHVGAISREVNSLLWPSRAQNKHKSSEHRQSWKSTKNDARFQRPKTNISSRTCGRTHVGSLGKVRARSRKHSPPNAKVNRRKRADASRPKIQRQLAAKSAKNKEVQRPAKIETSTRKGHEALCCLGGGVSPETSRGL